MSGAGWKHRVLTPLQVVLTLALFAEAAVIFGAALFPGVLLFQKAAEWLPATGGWRTLGLCIVGVSAYFIAGITLLVLLPLVRWLTFSLGTPLGSYDYFTWRGWQWASYNALTLFLRFSFIHWIRLTPFLNIYHRLMGMKIGARVQINTAVVADQNLISIGDDTVIGGDVTLVAHVVVHGRLHTAPIRIGNRVTVGLMAVIFPGCEIGDGAVIAAGSVLSKGTKVGPGEIWAGVPARRVGRRFQRASAPRPLEDAPPG